MVTAGPARLAAAPTDAAGVGMAPVVRAAPGAGGSTRRGCVERDGCTAGSHRGVAGVARPRRGVELCAGQGPAWVL